jgi:hypothetical protein
MGRDLARVEVVMDYCSSVLKKELMGVSMLFWLMAYEFSLQPY